MSYLLTQMLLCLLLAAVLGFILGWLLKRCSCAEVEAEWRGRYGMLEDERNRLRLQLESSRQPVVNFDNNDDTDSKAAMGLMGSVTTTRGVATPVESPIAASDYDVEEIEGIGKGYGKRLRALQIETTQDLLAKCNSESAVADVGESMGLEATVIKTWVCMADLLRVPEIDGQFAELLEWSDVHGVQQLAQQQADTLALHLEQTNAAQRRAENVPDAATLAQWIEAAKGLPEVLNF
ncbi:MAG: DUF4332 domain-containing protein [Pseudomonadales bacterium]